MSLARFSGTISSTMAKTPADKWRDAIIKYKKQCQSILKISNHIRYAGVINAYGKTLTGVVQPDLKPLLKSEEIKNEVVFIGGIVESIGFLTTVQLSPKSTVVHILPSFVSAYAVLK